MNIESRSGYARKQALGRGSRPGLQPDHSSFLEETRPCIRVYNEEYLPQKRNHSSDFYTDQKTFNPVLPDDFSKHFSRLEEIFSSASFSTNLEPQKVETKEEVQNILEVPSQSPLELLRSFATELDKACKLTPSQIKVLEKFGVEWNVDPWKYQSRPKSYSNYHRGKKEFKNRRPRTLSARTIRRFDEVNLEEISAELPKLKKPWSLFKGFIIKKLVAGVSVKKDLIAQSKLSQSSN